MRPSLRVSVSAPVTAVLAVAAALGAPARASEPADRAAACDAAATSLLGRRHPEFGDWSRAAGAFHSGTPDLARKRSARFDAIRRGVGGRRSEEVASADRAPADRAPADPAPAEAAPVVAKPARGRSEYPLPRADAGPVRAGSLGRLLQTAAARRLGPAG